MELCSVCQLEFPSSEPNVAVADAKIKGLGMWGYLCQAHMGHADKDHVTMLDSMNHAVGA